MIHIDLTPAMEDQLPMARLAAYWMISNNKSVFTAEDAIPFSYWCVDRNAIDPPPNDVADLIQWCLTDLIGIKVASSDINPFLKN